MADAGEEELVDYEEEAEEAPAAGGDAKAAAAPKKGYVGIHATGFKDFLLKPEILRAIVDCGFEHPSEGEWWEWGRASQEGVPRRYWATLPLGLLVGGPNATDKAARPGT
jgi:hypothetical protein